MKLTLMNPDLYGPGNTITEEAFKDSQENCYIDRRYCNQYFIPYSDTLKFTDQYFFVQTNIGLAPIAVNYYYICECQVSTTIQILVTDYILSKDESGNYYIVFKIPDLLQPPCSIFNIMVECDYGLGGKQLWITQQYYKEPCDQVVLLKACYEGSSGSNVDSNGIYFGWFNDELNSFGNLNLTYKHNYTVRKLTIKETGRSTTFQSTEKKNTEAAITKLSTLNIRDEVPSWYADYIQFALSVGVIQVDYGLLFANLPLLQVKEMTLRSIRDCCNTFHIQAVLQKIFEMPLPCVQDGVCVNCPKPFIVVTPLTPTSIQVEITDNYISTDSYDYTTDGGATWTAAPSQLFTITGLLSTGYYIIQVRHNCDVESSVSNTVDTGTYVCKTPIFSVQNITYYDMVVFINNFESLPGHSYDISIDNGATWVVLASVSQSNLISVSAGSTLHVKVRHHCPAGVIVTSSAQTIEIPNPIYCLELSNQTYLFGGNGVTGTFSATITLKDQFGNAIVNTSGSGVNITLNVTSIMGNAYYTTIIPNGSSSTSITYTINDPSDSLCFGCQAGASVPMNGDMATPMPCELPVCECPYCIFVLDGGGVGPSILSVMDCCGNILSSIPAPITVYVDIICGTSGSIGVIPVVISTANIGTFGPYTCPGGGSGAVVIDVTNNTAGYGQC